MLITNNRIIILLNNIRIFIYNLHIIIYICCFYIETISNAYICTVIMKETTRSIFLVASSMNNTKLFRISRPGLTHSREIMQILGSLSI